MTNGKTIQIFMPDGNPRSIKIAEITSRTIKNSIFTSPSAAAATVLARNANGWREWKYKNGKTLDEVKRKDQG